MKAKIQKIGIWALALIGYCLLIMNLIILSTTLSAPYVGLQIIGCITQAMMYNIFSTDPLSYIALGFIGGSFATYILIRIERFKIIIH